MFIGFFQSGKLKKVAATGGPAQTICEVLDSRGGAWGPDGTILFTDGPARPIFRVPSSGGMPAQLTTLAGGDPGEGHRSPEFLPDGRHFLFHATANNADNPGIQLGSLDGGAPMRLLPDDSNSIFVPVAGAAGGGAEGGHVFFLRDGTLMALPFDLTRLRQPPRHSPSRKMWRLQPTTSMVPFLWRKTAPWCTGVEAEGRTIASWSGWTAPASV